MTTCFPQKRTTINPKYSPLMLALIILAAALPTATAQDFYVSPAVDDSIQAALDHARPGDTIHLEPGIYYQSFDSVRDGTSAQPITITGPANAIVSGDGRGRIVQIFHDHHHLEGFTIDGLVGDSTQQSAYRDKLLYVQGTGTREGVSGLRVLNMTFKNAGGEAVRLRYFATHNEIAYSRFENIGVYDFRFNGGGKNGEAIYIGTSSNQWADGKNPTTDPDASHHNWIHDNYFDTNGNECVDIKEGAMYNIIERNVCTGQRDPNSGGLDSRGDANIFRYNEVYANSGAGIRLGGHRIEGHQYGVDNEVYGNVIKDNTNGGIKFMVSPQSTVCGNTFASNNGGDFVGSYGSDYTQTSCSTPEEPESSPLPPLSPTTPEPTPSPEPTPPVTTTSPYEYITGVSTSSFDERDGGHDATHTLDSDLGTRWSAYGDGVWIQYDLDGMRSVTAVSIAFHRGTERVQYFEVQTSQDATIWETVYEGKSSGDTNELQQFGLIDTNARFVRIIGHMNSLNQWNSLTEVVIETEATEPTPDTESHTPPPEAPDTDLAMLLTTVDSVSASSFDERDGGYDAAHTIDSDLSTRWSAYGDGAWIEYDLGRVYLITALDIAFHRGTERVQYFKVQTSHDTMTWETVYVGESSGDTNELQQFDLTDTNAQYVRIIGHTNSLNQWNSLTEVALWVFS